MASDAAAAPDSVEMETAWHLLTVLVRLGRPAAASDLAAAAAATGVSYASPRVVERMCRIPGSPLRLSDGGLVTASETAVAALLRFVGWDIPAPRASLRPTRCGEVTIRYERKRKGSGAGRFGAKRRLLLAPRADLVEHRECQSYQLVAQTCDPPGTGEVHLDVMGELQDRLPSIGTFIGEPSVRYSTGVTLAPSVAKIIMPGLKPGTEQSLRGNDGTVLVDMALALVSTQLPDGLCSIDLPLPDAERLENIHTAVDKINRISESEKASLDKCKVEDNENLGNIPILPPTTTQAILVQEKKNGIQLDLNIIYENPVSPISCNTKAADNIEIVNMTPDRADALQCISPNAGYHETAPTCGQDKSLLGSSGAEVHKDKTAQLLFQPPTDIRAEYIVPQMNKNVETAALPPETTRYDCIESTKLNSIAENREQSYLNHGEWTCNEAAVNVSKNGQNRKVVKQKEKSKKNVGPTKDDKDQLAAKSQKGHVVPKPFPNFKDFFIEEEEGSGGYGTVYRARREADGKIFAIKCPHPNANSHHVYNELKMLERFGGKTNVIKFECSLKSGDLECFVLEHVEHDRPEILKKEIDVFELRWYAYCLFRALASLHRQGIVHRDVKPGNFLFTRKLMKGYLIDFNLANDLHQKFLKNSKPEIISCGKNTISQTSSSFPMVVHAKEAVADSKQHLPSKRKRSNKSPVGSTLKIDNKDRQGNQAADISGVTSAKDPTSTKTPLDRLKQPMPYKGRKELMNFLHEAMQSPNNNTSPPPPVSQRKRVAAPFGSVDRKLFNLTPMPLRSGSSAVFGCGMFNTKGHGKHRREGPCVGTKGFRAPEVLFRSFHQGCKVDVWSAGVTLLYLIIGKTPFGGDPEQNIKEIAKLKGSEELWEVAKLHNCESSYPSDLFDLKSWGSVDLREWCTANTRRPDFLKTVPDSLFDLLDKCLAVNPRCRFTSEEALMHEFIAPCHESLRKRRMPRSAVSNAAYSSHQNTTLTVKLS